MSDQQAPEVWWDRDTNVVITDCPSWPTGTFTPVDAVRLVPAATPAPQPRAEEFVLRPPLGWLNRVDEVLRHHGAADHDGSPLGEALANLIRSWRGERDDYDAPSAEHLGPTGEQHAATPAHPVDVAEAREDLALYRQFGEEMTDRAAETAVRDELAGRFLVVLCDQRGDLAQTAVRLAHVALAAGWTRPEPAPVRAARGTGATTTEEETSHG